MVANTFIKRPVTAIVISIVLVLTGAICIVILPIDQYPDNVMFESDYPHGTSLSPGPASEALTPADTLRKNLKTVPQDIINKIVQDNAIRVYNLDL